MISVTSPAEKLQNFFGVFLQFQIGVDRENHTLKTEENTMKTKMNNTTAAKAETYRLKERKEFMRQKQQIVNTLFEQGNA